MYLAIGGKTVLRTKNIVGIYDTDSVTVSKHSRDLLNTAQRQNRMVVVSEYELPRSFLLVSENGEIKVYLSPVASSTLIKKSKQI